VAAAGAAPGALTGVRCPGALVALSAIALTGACGTAQQTATSAPPAASTRPSPGTPATTAPAATRDLAAYFRAAARLDARLRSAAVRINADISSAGTHFRPATMAAVKAADPASAGRLIPAGLTHPLLGAAILVQSDLVSRWYAFRPVLEGPTGVPSQDRERLHTCFAAGAPAAARFAADLAAARTLASESPPARHVEPASHAAAAVPLELALVDEANGGCDSCGGQIAERLPPIRWQHHAGADGMPPFDGMVGGILFRAQYHAGTGWDVFLNAC